MCIHAVYLYYSTTAGLIRGANAVNWHREVNGKLTFPGQVGTVLPSKIISVYQNTKCCKETFILALRAAIMLLVVNFIMQITAIVGKIGGGPSPAFVAQSNDSSLSEDSNSD